MNQKIDKAPPIFPFIVLGLFVILVLYGARLLLKDMEEIDRKGYDEIAEIIKKQPEMKPVVDSAMVAHNSMQGKGISGQ